MGCEICCVALVRSGWRKFRGSDLRTVGLKVLPEDARRRRGPQAALRARGARYFEPEQTRRSAPSTISTNRTARRSSSIPEPGRDRCRSEDQRDAPQSLLPFISPSGVNSWQTPKIGRSPAQNIRLPASGWPQSSGSKKTGPTESTPYQLIVPAN